MLFSEVTETIVVAPQLFKNHKIWRKSAASQLITFFTVVECCPSEFLWGYLMQTPHLACEQTTVQKGQALPAATCLLVVGQVQDTGLLSLRPALRVLCASQ